MNFLPFLPLLALCCFLADAASPVAKVIDLLGDMKKKVENEGNAKDATMATFMATCEKQAADLGYQIKTEKGQVEELTARSSKAEGKISAFASSIEQTQNSLAATENDLKAASDVRSKEQADFKTGEQELVGTMASLEKAVAVLQSKKGAALVQTKNAAGIVQAVEALLNAQMISSEDGQTLTTLLQDNAESDDAGFGEPAPGPAYAKKAGGIVDMLSDLTDKAKVQLDELRKKETKASHSFDMLRQSLNDQLKFGKADVEKAKQSMADEQGTKAQAQKDLGLTKDSLAKDQKVLSDTKMECNREVNEWRTEQKERVEELKAIDTATLLSWKRREVLLLKSIPSSKSTQLFEAVQIWHTSRWCLWCVSWPSSKTRSSSRSWPGRWTACCVSPRKQATGHLRRLLL